MNEFNFDSLKNIPVPEEMLSRALAIPEGAEAPPAPAMSVRRRLMAAAGFVLVFAVSLYAYFLFGNMNEPRIPVATASPSRSEATEPASDTVPDTTAPTDKATVPPIEELTQSPRDNATERPSALPGQKPSEAQRDEPTRPTSARPDEPTDPEPDLEPTAGPTDPPSALPSEPQAEQPTMPQVIDPTGLPVLPTAQPGEWPSEPWVVPTVEPVYEPDEYLSFMPFRLNGRQIEGGLYCSFIDRDGRSLDDGQPYSSSHKAEYEQKGDWIYVSFERAGMSVEASPLIYVRIYDENGTVYNTERIYP